MKKIIVLFALIIVFVITACNPYLPASWQLKGQTFTFITDGNGSNYITFTFNDDGTGGTMEIGYFTYGFATEAAETSGLYTDKSWYMTGGYRGTFTYDPETSTSTSTITEGYQHMPGVSTSYSDDYSWRSYLTLMVENYGSTVTAASMSMIQTTVFNSDTASYDGFFIADGENSWLYTAEETSSITDAGVITVSTNSETIRLTITNGSYVSNYTEVDYEKVGDATPTIETWITNRNYTINNFFISGEETGDIEFEKAWKEGNTVTFMLQRTLDEDIYYQGATAPAASSAPTPDGTTGIGSATGGTDGIDLWTWDIDQDEGNLTSEAPYTNYGDFILDSYYAIISYRGIE